MRDEYWFLLLVMPLLLHTLFIFAPKSVREKAAKVSHEMREKRKNFPKARVVR